MPPSPPTVSFDTTLSAFGNNTGIVVPTGVIEALGAGKRPPVDVRLNSYGYRTTVGSMKGQSMISVSAAIRAETGLAAGDPVSVTLTVNDTARDVTIPHDFAAALRDNDGAATFFAGLSNSLQRYHIDQITSAKTDDTRQRRIDKTINLFLDGKKR